MLQKESICRRAGERRFHLFVKEVQRISKRNGMQTQKSKRLLFFSTWQHGMDAEELMTDARAFELRKGLHVTKTLMSQELPCCRCAKKLALKICFKDVINEGGKRQ